MWDFNHEKGKVVKTVGIPMPDGAVMKNIKERGYKYCGVLQADVIKHEQKKNQLYRYIKIKAK